MVTFFRKEGKGWDINLTNVTIGVILTLVLIQTFGILFGRAFGLDIFLGPVMIMFMIGVLSIVAVALAKMLLNKQPLSKRDFFLVLIISGIVLLTLIFLRDLVPEIFIESVIELQSVLGF
jgi:hypothetical protein